MAIEGRGRQHEEGENNTSDADHQKPGMNRRKWINTATGSLFGAAAMVEAAGKLMERPVADRFLIFKVAVERDHLPKSEQKAFRDNLEYLTKEFPPFVFDELLEAERVYGKELPPKPPEVAGFEALGVTDTEALIDFLSREGWYPKGTVKANITGIYFHPFSKKGLKDGPLRGGNMIGEVDGRTIHLYLSENISSPKDIPGQGILNSFIWNYAHEWGHMNDPFRSQGLSLKQRVDFLTEVSKVFDKKGTAYDDQKGDMRNYVAKIKYSDKRRERYDKVIEFWAVLCHEFLFSFGQMRLDENKDEFDVTKKWLTIKDPDFNDSEQKKKLMELWNTSVKKIYDQMEAFTGK